jgi:hypothetical protein
LELSSRVNYIHTAVRGCHNSILNVLFLRVLEFTSTPFSSLHSFTLPYTKPRTATGSKTRGAGGVEPPIDLDNPPPALDAELPIPYAIEFLGEILEMVTSAPEAQKDGEDVAVSSGVRAGDLYASLAREYDPVRHRCALMAISLFVTRMRAGPRI